MSGAARRAIKRIAEACGVEVRRLAPGDARDRCSLSADDDRLDTGEVLLDQGRPHGKE